MLVCATRCRLEPGNAIPYCRSEPDAEEDEEMRSVRGVLKKDEDGTGGKLEKCDTYDTRGGIMLQVADGQAFHSVALSSTSSDEVTHSSRLPGNMSLSWTCWEGAK